MHDMVEEVVGPIVREKFRHEKFPWGVVMNNMRPKGVESMSSNLLLMEPLGGSFGRFLPTCRTAWCGVTFCTKGVTIGLGCAPQVVAAGGLGLPGSCGPSLARISPENWGPLSRCLFDERRVEFELSSWGVWCVGVCRSYGLTLHVSGIAPTVPWYIDSGSGLEFATWPFES